MPVDHAEKNIIAGKIYSHGKPEQYFLHALFPDNNRIFSAVSQRCGNHSLTMPFEFFVRDMYADIQLREYSFKHI